MIFREGKKNEIRFQISDGRSFDLGVYSNLSLISPDDVFIRLQIFDVLGKPVRPLVQQKENDGYKSAIWNGKDDFGKPVSGGVYLYRLEACEFRKTGKMALVK